MLSQYDQLLEAGWRMGDIDDMDFCGFLQVLGWRLNKEQGPRYIDQIGLFGLGVS